MATTKSVSSTVDTTCIIAPHLTEKSSRLAGMGQYTFVVTPHAEKVAIARAIAVKYHVHPVHVTIVRTPGKTVRYGRIVGRRSGMKKAVITVKKGEKIPFGVNA